MTIKDNRQPLLQVSDLKQHFFLKKEKLFGAQQVVKAVDGVSFEIMPGETLSIVGESGCGKSTTGRAILRLDEPTSGEVLLFGKNLVEMNKKELRVARKDIQIIFQDPYASLNPRRTIRKMLSEAMSIQKIVPPAQQESRMLELMALVGLRPEYLERYPHEFSGGQRQRIGIARALAVNPKIIICDESVSALDVSIQAQILNLLKKLQRELDLTFLFISHDLSVVRHISDRVMVMYLGKVVEIADKKSLFSQPLHPYTKALLSSIPIIDKQHRKERIILKGDIPSPLNPPTGCSFHTRCPFATDKCRVEVPALREIKTTQKVACHFAENLV
ncbi:dipeptide ABC transporter ATP-binding protein [Lysinibacillus sphaericus]|uniref:ABC transporter ATP-binding protein n=1 Tax=Lysinibacillus sphaericus TaxID=1421 RepID=A0A2S0JXM1_LYSSH|nr:dipeptide ABC transporter ATP-binding protein [Lysinibacillus sphaericus]AVK95819.1 ABC transporter ATP-binding protein [Lysinibacillus sphaericus]MCS1380594.1 dipeptide ABC transporter ATP-binding protein [Lysinibacillus sphaericus]MED4544895.1 dipeptide ABC transporter ATP-binding protein [Lysinibacillus sphaericus]TKI21555.1 dipeptide ABC transporter ATP-binding protein [Lysinibacillus sphaericus]UDK98053.1 dipeptide ABC transporter ATP-binding protein [Lysinibacillus sphaericus]